MSTYVGNVISLFLSHHQKKERIEKDYIVVNDKGILEDKFYDKDIERSILITSLDSYAITKKLNIDMPYGSLGENILIDYNPYQLTPGTKIHIGNTLLEISQYCTICNHLSSIDTRVPHLLKNDRGIFAKVLKKGDIKKGDKVELVEI